MNTYYKIKMDTNGITGIELTECILDSLKKGVSDVSSGERYLNPGNMTKKIPTLSGTISVSDASEHQPELERLGWKFGEVFFKKQDTLEQEFHKKFGFKLR